MKYLLTTLLLVFLLTSCEKEAPFPIYEAGDTSLGSAKGEKNGFTWKSSTYAQTYIDQGVLFHVVRFTTFNDQGLQREEMTIGPLFIDKRYYSPCLLYTSPSPRDRTRSRMPSSA